MKQMQLGVDPLRESEQEAEEAAVDGMEKAWRAHRVQLWKEDAAAWLEALPVGTEFVADDLVHDIALPDVGPSRNNVVGAWFSGQAKAGRIAFANRMRRSKRVVRHGNPQRVWRKV